MTEIELHEEVERWMDGLDEGDLGRTIVAVDRLARAGPLLRMPHSKPLGLGVFELRFALGAVARRITYRFTPDGRAVLLTTFHKQRNNERGEVERARLAAAECVRHHH
jgi:hypothetical protein